MSRAFALVNPTARGGRMAGQWPELESRLRQALGGTELEVGWTTPEERGEKQVRAALQGGATRIVVVGGDGTLSDAIQGFFDEKGLPMGGGKAALSVIPSGRGDDFFKAVVGERVLNSGKLLDLAFALIEKGQPTPLDLVRCSFAGGGGTRPPRYFLNVGSFGFPGLVVHRVLNHVGWMGRGRIGKSAITYILQSTAAMLSYKPVSVEVVADGASLYRGPIYSGFCLNGWYNAGGVRWSPSARLDDGLLDVLVLEPRGFAQSLTDGGRMLSGRWEGPGAHRIQAKVVDVRLLDPSAPPQAPLFELDGDQPEPSGCTGARFELLPGVTRLWR